MGGISQRGADDAKATKTVPQTDRDDAGDQRVFLQLPHSLQRHVAGGNVQVQHAAQDQLQRAALGAHHEVNTGQITLERTA